MSQFDKLDKVLFIWFSQERQRGKPMSGPLIQEMATYLNKLMNGKSSQLTDGKIAQDSQVNNHRREAVIWSHDIREIHWWVCQFDNNGELLSLRCLQRWWNWFKFKALPTKRLASKEDKCAQGFKMSKECVTLNTCSSAAGTHRLPFMTDNILPYTIKPHVFKNTNTLHDYCRNQKKAWMEGNLFKQWFHNQFVCTVTRFNKKNELPIRALLLINNALSHPNMNELTCS